MQALQQPDLCFSDPELAASEVARNPLGLPHAVSGNFATVFRLTDPAGGEHAVRCFVRCPPDVGERYTALGRHLTDIDAPWKVPFDYQHRGVRIERHWYPLIRTPWVEGTSLAGWIAEHLWDSHALAGLAVRFARLVEDLRACRVAHGDLQHGNILVGADGELRLIDYDGMWVPGLAKAPSGELGHRNYQHPGRSATDWGPHLDHFASWVIYTSLLSLSVDPLLWGRLDAGDECLLFRSQDFADPIRSAAFACLESRPDSTLAELAAALRAFVTRPVDELPPLPAVDDLLPRADGPVALVHHTAGARFAAGPDAHDRVRALLARRQAAAADEGDLPRLRAEQAARDEQEAALVAADDSRLAAALGDITAASRALRRAEQAELAAAFMIEREERLQAGLQARPISSLRAAGVTEAIQASLAWVGVRTAGDFVTVEPGDNRHGPTVVLSDGRRAQLDSLGAGPGQALADWRQRLEHRLSTQIVALTEKRQAEVVAQFEPQRRELNERAAALRAGAAARRNEIRREAARHRAELTDAMVAEQSRLAAVLHAIDGELSDARRALAEAAITQGVAASS